MALPASNTYTKRPREIGIDGGSWSNRRGYGRFLRELLPEVVALRPDWRFTVFLDQPQPDTIEAPNLKWLSARTNQSVADAASADGYRSPVDLLRMGQAVNRVKLDLLFFPTVFSYFPVARRIPMIVGIHDTMADRFPQWAFDGKKNELLWRAKVKMALAQATRIMTVSEYSKRTIVELFQTRPEEIGVVSEAAAAVFRPLGLEREPFLLAVGGISPNKNLDLLIRILPELRKRRPELRLVLVGDYTKDAFRSCYQGLRALVDATQCGSAVEFAGFVPDGELAKLYNRCEAFVMPSLEEGFGLPLVEAMACGCACIVASGHSLEEVGADAVVTADPRNDAAWIDALTSVTRYPELRAKAIERAEYFTWRRGAEALIRLFEETLAQ